MVMSKVFMTCLSKHILLIASWLQLPVSEKQSHLKAMHFWHEKLHGIQCVLKWWSSFSIKYNTVTREWRVDMIWLLERKRWSGRISQQFHTSLLRVRLDRTAPTSGIMVKQVRMTAAFPVGNFQNKFEIAYSSIRCKVSWNAINTSRW